MILTFGKYKGVEIERIPISYICWLIDESVNLDPLVEQVVLKRYHSKEGVQHRLRQRETEFDPYGGDYDDEYDTDRDRDRDDRWGLRHGDFLFN